MIRLSTSPTRSSSGWTEAVDDATFLAASEVAALYPETETRCLRVETEEQAVRTFSLEEYADAVRGSHDPVDVMWLERQFRKGGRLEGLAFKSGRKWRGTADQIDAAIERLTPKPVAVPSVPSTSGMCKTTQRRLSA